MVDAAVRPVGFSSRASFASTACRGHIVTLNPPKFALYVAPLRFQLRASFASTACRGQSVNADQRR